jgi:hypothetical protein
VTDVADQLFEGGAGGGGVEHGAGAGQGGIDGGVAVAAGSPFLQQGFGGVPAGVAAGGDGLADAGGAEAGRCRLRGVRRWRTRRTGGVPWWR